MSPEQEFDPNQPPSSAEVLTFELFYSRWGDTVGMSKHQLETMWKTAQINRAEMPYHNWGHTVETLWIAMEHADECEEHGVEVNRKVLAGAVLFHDAFYDRDQYKAGFDTKEQHSAAIFKYNAPSFGFSTQDTQEGVEIIHVTEVGQVPKTIEQKIMIRSDLDNIGQDFEKVFYENTLKIYEELSYGISREDPSYRFNEFRANTVKLLSGYLENDLLLGEFDREHYSHWLRTAHGNLKYLAQSIEKNGTINEELARALGRISLPEDEDA